ncbi:MAG: peptidase M20, partial [Solimonas sp.]
FTPMLTHPADDAAHPNPMVRLGGAIAVVQRWAKEFEVRHRYESAGGTAIPKVQIGAVRGGNPQAMGAGSEICKLYVHVNLTPADTVNIVDRELKQAFRDAGIGGVTIEPYTVRHGYEADARAVQPLQAALDAAHRIVRGAPQAIGDSFYSSMWRDHNVFNMNRIPAVTMGPVRWRPTVSDLVACTRLYALAALALCGRAGN